MSLYLTGDINPSKRVKKESTGGIMKKIKVPGVPNDDNFQKSGEIVVTGGHALTSG